MPDSRSKTPHPDRIRERKGGIPKREEGEPVSSPESNRDPSLLAVSHNKLFLFILLGIIIVGLLLLTQFRNSPKTIGTQKAAAPPIAKANDPAPSSASNPPSENVSPVVRQAQFNAKNTSLSPDEILARAKRAVFLLKTPQGSGTGFLLSPDGIVVTRTRIIGRNDEAEVLVPSGIKKAAVLKRLTDPLDLAFLKVEKSDLEDEALQHSDICKEGEEIMVFGFPSGEKSGEPTLTTGIIRNCNSPYQGVRYFQLDPAVASENTGSPVVNLKGEVIGIFKGKLALNGQEEMNVGLPIQTVRAIVEDKLVHLEERGTRKVLQVYLR
jgi:S1-C subfamily serine protease